MIKTDLQIYLASGSPRRKKLLKQLGIKFKTLSVNFDEKINGREKPVYLVKRLALEKMNLAHEKIESGIIITADTIVVLDNKIIGKPSGKTQAKKFLRLLSGKEHIVYTGFVVLNTETNQIIVDYEKTKVKFRKLDDDEINDYVNSGSPMDKAGAYGIQDDFGAVFVEKINGCYYNVVGLPLTKLYHALRDII
jgi:septum formation protein